MLGVVLAAIRTYLTRHAPGVAAGVLLFSVAGTAAALLAARIAPDTERVGSADLVYVACQILPYGVMGAVLLARRPDLPFGWLLSVSALSLVLMLGIAGPSVVALEHGHGGQLAVWGLGAGALMFVPTAIEGLVNLRFPSGTPSSRSGRLLERAIVVGIVVAVAGAAIGDSTVRAVYPHGPPGGEGRFVDGTVLATLGNATVVLVPLVILLGVLAGIGVVVRFLRSDGVERLQLRWRAAGVVAGFLLFPLAVTETLPDVVSDVWPLLFVATLAVPVLRYDLWAIDSIIRRSAVGRLDSPGAVVQNLVRTTAEMLRLPYVAVRRGDRLIASCGEAPGHVETWPLVEDEEHLGELVAAPRHGYAAIAPPDRKILATLGELVAGSVRAEVLTADLLEARRRLVTAREEERRRLRRDLHDGLGPLLTGLGLNLDAARAQLDASPTGAATYLAHARAASTEVIASLRDLVEGLRPTALDELGLAGSLKLHLEPLAHSAGFALDLRLSDHLRLPAAVEVAVFRTAVEAVTNVARHSDARRTCVDIAEAGGVLALTVSDDGTGRSPWRAGVGLTGMRERAEELGGAFEALATPEGGRVRASYPIDEAST